MHYRAIIFLLIVLVFLQLSCSSNDQAEQPQALLEKSGLAKDTKLYARLVINLPGDDFASVEDVEKRNQIQRLIHKRGIGEVIVAGTGMGMMDITMTVLDRNSYQKAIGAVVSEILPGTKFSIEILDDRKLKIMGINQDQ